METTGDFRLVTCFTVALLLGCCWAAEKEFYPLHPAFPLLRSKEIKIETVYRTIHKTTVETFTEYPTCTAAASDIQPCLNMRVARTQRSLFSVSAKRHTNLQVILPLYATREFQLHDDNKVISDEPEHRELLGSSFLSEDAVEKIFPGQLVNEVVGDSLSAPITPGLRLIIVRLTTTETLYSAVMKTNAETTVGITYNGCIPADAPVTTACPVVQ